MSNQGPKKANPVPEPKGQANPWIPDKVPSFNIPYDENFYKDITQKMEKRLAELKEQAKNDPSLISAIDNYNSQICIVEIVRRLHSDFEGKINAIANSWWSHVRKLERAPENAPLYQAQYKGENLNAFVFHFKDFIGKPNLPKNEQMKNIANKLKSLVEQFHYAYEIANKYDALDAVVNSCGGGCFEGQVEGVFTGANNIDRKHLAQKPTQPSEHNYFLEKHQALSAAMDQLKEVWDKHHIDHGQMYAQEMLSYLKEHLGANSKIRMGDEKVSNLFFDVTTDEEALAILEAYSYPSLPDKNEKDPNKAWLGKFSDVLSDIEDVTDSLHLRRLRVLEQAKYEGGKESCGYHGIKNAFGMLTAINKGVNPAGTVFDEKEFARVYNYFKANVVSKRGYGAQDLYLNEAQEFLNKIENKGLEKEGFGDYAKAYSEIKSKQGGIAPISIVPISLDDEEQCHYLPGAATTNNIIDLYKIATNPKQALDHTFLVADSALGAGHWLTLLLHVNADGTKQWVSMDSDNNRATRAERVANLLNSMLAKPEVFIKEAFEDKFKDAIAIRAKYIDKNSKQISQENKKVLLTKETEDEQLNVISDAIKMLGETAIKREDVQSTLDNMALLIDFYANESKQAKAWNSLKEKLQQQAKPIETVSVVEISKEKEKPTVEVKLPAKNKMATFEGMFKNAQEDWQKEWGEKTTEAIFNKAKERYEVMSSKVPMIKMTEGEFIALKTHYLEKPALEEQEPVPVPEKPVISDQQARKDQEQKEREAQARKEQEIKEREAKAEREAQARQEQKEREAQARKEQEQKQKEAQARKEREQREAQVRKEQEQKEREAQARKDKEQKAQTNTTSADFPEFTTFSKMPILKKYANKEKIANKAGKLLYKLNNGKVFWKALKGNRKTPEVEEGREVAGAWIANHITNGAVPRSHIREVDAKLGIAQEYVDIETFTKDSIKKLNKDQVTQILIHLIADKAVSNYDAHLDNYGLNKDGQVIGIDKGEAFRFFQRNKVGFKTALAGAGHDSDEINLDQYGKTDINFYKQVFELVKQGNLEVDFDDSRVVDALKRCTELSLDDVKKMYSGYAELQFKQPAKREEFYKEVHARLQNMPNALANFRAKVQKVHKQEDTVKPQSEIKPQSVIKSQSEIKRQSVIKPQSEIKPQSVIKPQSEVKPQSIIKPQSEIKPQSVIKPQSEIKPQSVIKPQSEIKPQSAIKPQSEIKPQSDVKPQPIVRSPSINKPQSVIKPEPVKPPVVNPQSVKPPVVVKPQPVKPQVHSKPAFSELTSSQAVNFNKMLNMFGQGEAEIVKKINEIYQHEKSKGKGFFSKRNVGAIDIAKKRTMQITDLAIIIGDLQRNKTLTSHEKGILLQGALQVVIDNIARTEINSPTKSSLSKMCHKLIDSLHKDKIGVDSTQAKILYNIYRSTNDNPEEKFREAAHAGKLQQRRNQGK